MIRYRLSRRADDDLDRLAHELGKRDAKWAVRVLEGLHTTLEFLGTHPLAALNDRTCGLTSAPSQGATPRERMSSSITRSPTGSKW